MMASYPLGFIVASACIFFVTAGCAGQSGSSVPYVEPDLVATLDGRAHENAGEQSFLYVSDAGEGDVQVYKWPKPRNPIGTLTDFSEPQGLCNDGKDAYITSTTAAQIVEYAAGATSPLRTIDDPYGLPVACSVDPVTGDLAVSNLLSKSYGPGSLVIYPKATGKPREITSKNIAKFGSVQYDGSGNLFLQGLSSGYATIYAEIKADSKRIKPICSPVELVGGIGWDGTYIVLSAPGGVYRVKGCKTVGFTPLDGASDIGQFYIAGNKLIEPDAGNLNVGIYPYPKGGAAELTLSGFSQPIGATVVSRAASNHR